MSNDGGPAFPYVVHTGTRHVEELGMSLRDYFAAAALQGFIMRSADLGNVEYQSHEAFRYADAMLAERSKP